MAASRDDFIIAIRSAFLKKENKQRFSLVGLIFFSVVLIILSNLNFVAINYIKSGLNEIVYRISFIVSIPEKQLQKLASSNAKLNCLIQILNAEDEDSDENEIDLVN